MAQSPPTLELTEQLPVSLQRHDNAEYRYRGLLLGKVSPELLLVSLLEDAGLQANDRVIVRAVQSGKAIGFQSTISAVVEEPVRLLFLLQPSDLEVMNLRKADRIGLFVPVDVRHSSGQDSQADTLLLQGNMLDLSGGGCRIYTRRSIPAKTTVNLSFHLPGEKRLNAISGAVIDSYAQNVVFGQRVKFFTQEKNLEDLNEIRRWIQQNLDFADLSP